MSECNPVKEENSLSDLSAQVRQVGDQDEAHKERQVLAAGIVQKIVVDS